MSLLPAMTVEINAVLTPDAKAEVERIASTAKALLAQNDAASTAIATAGPLVDRLDKLVEAGRAQVDALHAAVEATKTKSAAKEPGAALLTFFEEVPRERFTFEVERKVRSVHNSYLTLARALVASVPAGAERTIALRKLMESRDSAVRATLFGTVQL